MLFSVQTDYARIVAALRTGWVYLPLIVGVWVAVYACNAAAFRRIAGEGISYALAYKLTVSGFAFSYTTPFGFGGGPYRVMELAGRIGLERGMSAVVLYSMMHILSHFCLWLTAALLLVTYYAHCLTPGVVVALVAFLAVTAGALVFFYFGYRDGLLVRLYRVLLLQPFLRRRLRAFLVRHLATMQQIDRNIAALRRRPRTFLRALGEEYAARLLNAFEFYFIFAAFGLGASYADALMVLALSSLVGNVLFFFPMQMGAREGGIALALSLLRLGVGSGAALGVFAGALTRLRELFWIAAGVLLVKVNRRRLRGVRTLFLDYGGTLDTGARHWSHVLREGYEAAGLQVAPEAFRAAYVHGERTLAREPLIAPTDDFRTLLAKKVRVELDYLLAGQHLSLSPDEARRAVEAVVGYCDDYVRSTLQRVRPILQRLGRRYRLVLVSNFYGNLPAVLQGYGLSDLFPLIIESAREGVRKPSPAIYRLALQRAAEEPGRVVMVGDSWDKDIVPAREVGLRTVYYKGEAWDGAGATEGGDAEATDAVITDLGQLEALL